MTDSVLVVLVARCRPKWMECLRVGGGDSSVVAIVLETGTEHVQLISKYLLRIE